MPLTPDEVDDLGRYLDDWVRTYERNQKIPEYLTGVEKWIAAIKANPDDVRNSPNVGARSNGTSFFDLTTDLDAIAKHVLLTRAQFEGGEFELALSSMEELRARVAKANARKTEAELTVARKVLEGSKDGAAKRTTNFCHRNLGMAQEYRALMALDRNISETQAMIIIGKRHKLKRTAAIAAVQAGLKYCPAPGQTGREP